MHNNIRSINKNFDELQILLSQFDSNFDLIALSETWRICNHENFKLEGYDTLYNDGNINQNDGVIVFIRNSLNYNYQIININQIKCIKLYITVYDKVFGVNVLYRPPSVDIEDFNINFRNFLAQYCKNQNEIIVGDININLFEDSPYVNTYLNNLYEFGFLSCIDGYTRYESKSCIDHIFLKSKINLDKIFPVVLETTITDHHTII